MTMNTLIRIVSKQYAELHFNFLQGIINENDVRCRLWEHGLSANEAWDVADSWANERKQDLSIRRHRLHTIFGASH